MVTIKNIAKEAQVSIFTVSRILNNKSSNIPFSNETVKKVKSIAKKHNYQKKYFGINAS
ncbi:LacI family DNA-binding transcriptional regulator [bacterium]|nr:LacI family DNA-binding transcriptional regulator [bacterium]